MDKFKNLTDEELIKLLRNYGIQHGPIVDSTRTLYEKRLFECEREKKTYPGSAESSYESKQKYSTREYDDDQVHILKSVKDNYKGKLQVQKSEQQRGVETSRDFSHPDLPQSCFELRQTKQDFHKEENPAHMIQEQKKGARKLRQNKVTRETRKKKGVRETEQAFAANSVSDSCASASTVEGIQEAEVKVASSSTPRPRQARHSRPSTQRLHNAELLDSLKFKLQRPVEEKPSYYLAMSLVPFLDEVPEEKMVALHHDLVNLITSYYPDALPKPLQASITAPFPTSAQH